MNIRNDRIDDSRIPASFERPTDDKAKSYVKQTKLGNDYVWKVGLEKSGTFSGPWQKIKHTLQDLFCRGKVVHIPLKDLGSDSRIELNRFKSAEGSVHLYREAEVARLSLLGTKQRFEAIAEKMWALTATLDDLATRQPTENDKENVSRQLEDISYLVANFSEDFTDEKVSSKSSDYQSSDAEKLRQKFGVDVSDKTFAEAAASIKERLDHRIKNAGISPS